MLEPKAEDAAVALLRATYGRGGKPAKLNDALNRAARAELVGGEHVVEASALLHRAVQRDLTAAERAELVRQAAAAIAAAKEAMRAEVMQRYVALATLETKP